MILIQIRQYLKKREQASLSDIALHVNAEKDAVQGMLDMLVRRGEISLGMMTSACQSSCTQCDSSATALYFWGQQKNCLSSEVTTNWT